MKPVEDVLLDGVAISDMNWNIIQYNATYAKMLGFKRAEETMGHDPYGHR